MRNFPLLVGLVPAITFAVMSAAHAFAPLPGTGYDSSGFSLNVPSSWAPEVVRSDIVVAPSKGGWKFTLDVNMVWCLPLSTASAGPTWLQREAHEYIANGGRNELPSAKVWRTEYG